MSELHPGITIGATSIRRSLNECPQETTPEELAKKAMEMAHDDRHVFMCATDDQQFKAGVGGLILALGDRKEDDALHRVNHEMRMLGALSAAMSGVPVDFGAAIGEDPPKPFGLMGMFQEAKTKGSGL